jgi:hypothetical protein
MLVLGAIQLAFTANSCLAQNAGAITPVVTFDKVLEYLQMEVREEKIIKAVEGTTFILGQGQVAALKQAGASDALIAAMVKKGQTIAVGSDFGTFVFILDCSGSMKDKAQGGTTKWAAAQKAALDLVTAIPEGRNIGFVVYGLDASKECLSVDTLRALSPMDAAGKAELTNKIKALRPAGHTPIAIALNKAGEELAKSQDMAKLILITDGMETCHGDPTKAAADLLISNPHLRGGVDVIGFGLKAAESQAVEKIALAGKGQYYNAVSVDELAKSVRAIESQLKPVKPEVVATATLSDKKPSTSISAPVPLDLGEVVSGRLGNSGQTKKYHYWSVDLPAGTYKFVLDVKRADDRDSLMGGELAIVVPDEADPAGKEVQSIGSIIENDHKRRGVFVIKAEGSLKGIVRYMNRDTISDYQLAVFEEGGEFLTPFFVKCPKVNPINVGDIVKVPPLDGANNLARDAFYSATLPAGDYKLSAEFRRVDGKNSLMGGRVAVLSSDGHELQHPVSVTENAVSEKGFAKLSLAEDQPLIFQVRTAHTLETAVLKVEPWIEE